MKTEKNALALLMALVMVFGLVPSISSAVERPDLEPMTQSRYYNFSTNYTLTGDGASDMVAIALAQEGKAGSDLGYTEQWCADFIGDCAVLAGQSAAIPANGYVPSLRDLVLNAGGAYSTSNPQPGDLCFIDWSPNDGTTSYDHVELVYAVSGTTVYTIGGNTGGGSDLYTRKVAKHAPLGSSYVICTVRPNYSGAPTYANVSTDKTSYQVDETVTFTTSSNGVTNTLWIYCPNGEILYYQDVPSSYQLAFGMSGHFQALVEAWNGIGSFCSELIDFYVGIPTFATIATKQSSYNVDEYVTFSIDSDGITNTLWIYCPNGERLYYQDVPSTYQLAFGMSGHFQALVQAWNGIGSFCSELIDFYISDNSGAFVGDVNNDGVLSFVDVASLYNAILSGDGLSDEQAAICDVNGDGAISFADVAALYNTVLGSAA